MGLELSLDDIRRAWDARDPELANLIIHLASAADPRPAQPPREGALSFASFTAQLGTGKFRREQPQARARYRIDTMKALEAANAEVPLPPRLQRHRQQGGGKGDGHGGILCELTFGTMPFTRRSIMALVSLRSKICSGAYQSAKRPEQAEANAASMAIAADSASFIHRR